MFRQMVYRRIHAGLLAMRCMVGAIVREVARRGELHLDPVQPRTICRRVCDLDGDCLRPVSDATAPVRSQVRREVVTRDGQAHSDPVEAAQVSAEGEELSAGLGVLDMPVEPVGGQIVGGEQVPHPVESRNDIYGTA